MFRKIRTFFVAKFAIEKKESLLLVLACFLVLSNHFNNLSAWISVSTVGLMLWRAWLTLLGRKLPPRWILIPIALALMAGIFWQFRSFFGRETGVAMLALLLSCKLLEMHAKRDLFVILFLGFFLLLTSFFESQSIGTALQVAVAAFVLLLAQLSFQFNSHIPSLWQRSVILLKMLAFAIPLTIISFYLFPRIQGPLWGLPGDANTSRSGLSDSMAPGNISKLAMSEELVFRVKFLQEVPQKSDLYWRAIVLSSFDGRRWTEGRGTKEVKERELEVFGKGISQEITLEPANSHLLFGLDSVLKPPFIENKPTEINFEGEMFSPALINHRIRYQVVSHTRYRHNVNEDPLILRHNLRIPANLNPETKQFAQNLSLKFNETQAKVNAVLRHFREEKFYYTLEPPLLGRNSIDDFLFNTKTGFCEHYASAFVVLMRAMGVPARVVTGYQGGTLNTQDQYYEVRQSDAHAWAEVWESGQGWIRVDPTAAVAPERILQNLSATQKSTGFAGLVGDLIKENAWSKALRMRWSAINNSWNQWVLNYNQAQQSRLLEILGLHQIDWSKALTSLFFIGIVVVGLLAIPLIPKAVPMSAQDKLYAKFCAKFKNFGIERAIHEPPSSYLERIKPVLEKTKYKHAEQFIAYYVALKYGKMTNSNLVLKDMRALLKKL
ncbi:transglutaminase family protein [Undibacterium fentianense]|uniref:DUF3488 domain-containing transglutaminase family protein n=1 Tax=Undibacterium fentianense TaxID=2828728 RepID=A0A941E193_9BURK|nr:DUF3488 and transglutaminase-like domain-containing protein [Undibacterium fentianense]MBR7799212.1 DUF3488 domain-containing transglutaminase family protein [Undibacterium fentianense]